MIFPGTTLATAEANATFWAKWDPNSADSYSKAVSVTIDGSALTDNTDTFQVMGSNESNNADAVPVADESGSSTARTAGHGWDRANFPYQYIGLKFVVGGGSHTGTFAAFINTAAIKTSLV
jgi:hypothetical protein